MSPSYPAQRAAPCCAALASTFLLACAPAHAAEPVVPQRTPEQLDTVTVLGTRPIRTVDDLSNARRKANERTGGTAVIDGESYRDRRAGTLVDALGFAPGVFVQPRFGADEARVSIRGSGLQRTFHGRGLVVLQDGTPINLADGSFDMQAIEPLAARYITVYRGANALEYGAATLGGAIDFVSPTGFDAPMFTRARGGRRVRFPSLRRWPRPVCPVAPMVTRPSPARRRTAIANTRCRRRIASSATRGSVSIPRSTGACTSPRSTRARSCRAISPSPSSNATHPGRARQRGDGPAARLRARTPRRALGVVAECGRPGRVVALRRRQAPASSDLPGARTGIARRGRRPALAACVGLGGTCSNLDRRRAHDQRHAARRTLRQRRGQSRRAHERVRPTCARERGVSRATSRAGCALDGVARRAGAARGAPLGRQVDHRRARRELREDLLRRQPEARRSREGGRACASVRERQPQPGAAEFRRTHRRPRRHAGRNAGSDDVRSRHARATCARLAGRRALSRARRR